MRKKSLSLNDWDLPFSILSTQYNGSTEANRREHTNRHGCKICQMNQNIKYISSWLFCIPWSLMLVITSWFYIDESCEDQISHSEFNFVQETVLFSWGIKTHFSSKMNYIIILFRIYYQMFRYASKNEARRESYKCESCHEIN